MSRPIFFATLAVLVTIAAAGPVPDAERAEHHLAKRGLKHFVNSIKTKVSHLDLHKVEHCLTSTPGVKSQASSIVKDCIAKGGMAAIAACAAAKGAIPAARATAHLAACVG